MWWIMRVTHVLYEAGAVGDKKQGLYYYILTHYAEGVCRVYHP